MFRTLRFIVPLLTALVVAGCGGGGEDDPSGERASARTDVDSLLRSTFSNMEKMKSATVDLKVQIDPRGASAAKTGAVSARLQGPFASQGANKLPKFAFAADLQAGGQSFDAGVTWTGSKGYVGLQGTSYEVSDLVMKQFVAGYEQALASRRNAKGGLVLGTLGIDFTKWLKNARNEGTAQVGDAETVKVTGAADVAQVIADLDKITERASSLNVPGAGGRVPQKLTPAQKQQAQAAIKSLDVEVYTGTEDRILRRLVVTADLKDAESNVDAAILLDLTFTKVGQDQQIEPPAGARPFSELLKALDDAGLTGFGLGGSDGGGEQPEPSTSPNNVDEYAACIKRAKSDAEARKCASLLSSG